MARWEDILMWRGAKLQQLYAPTQAVAQNVKDLTAKVIQGNVRKLNPAELANKLTGGTLIYGTGAPLPAETNLSQYMIGVVKDVIPKIAQISQYVAVPSALTGIIAGAPIGALGGLIAPTAQGGLGGATGVSLPSIGAIAKLGVIGTIGGVGIVAAKSVSDAIGNVGDSISGAIDNSKNVVTKIADDIGNAINDLTNSVDDALHNINLPDINIPFDLSSLQSLLGNIQLPTINIPDLTSLIPAFNFNLLGGGTSEATQAISNINLKTMVIAGAAIAGLLILWRVAS